MALSLLGFMLLSAELWLGLTQKEGRNSNNEAAADWAGPEYGPPWKDFG
jgi:hypothetical protein